METPVVVGDDGVEEAVKLQARALAANMARTSPDLYGIIVECVDWTIQGVKELVDGTAHLQATIAKLELIHEILEREKPT